MFLLLNFFFFFYQRESSNFFKFENEDLLNFLETYVLQEEIVFTSLKHINYSYNLIENYRTYESQINYKSLLVETIELYNSEMVQFNFKKKTSGPVRKLSANRSASSDAISFKPYYREPQFFREASNQSSDNLKKYKELLNSEENGIFNF